MRRWDPDRGKEVAIKRGRGRSRTEEEKEEGGGAILKETAITGRKEGKREAMDGKEN